MLWEPTQEGAWHYMRPHPHMAYLDVESSGLRAPAVQNMAVVSRSPTMDVMDVMASLHA